MRTVLKAQCWSLGMEQTFIVPIWMDTNAVVSDECREVVVCEKMGGKKCFTMMSVFSGNILSSSLFLES